MNTKPKNTNNSGHVMALVSDSHKWALLRKANKGPKQCRECTTLCPNCLSAVKALLWQRKTLYCIYVAHDSRLTLREHRVVDAKVRRRGFRSATYSILCTACISHEHENDNRAANDINRNPQKPSNYLFTVIRRSVRSEGFRSELVWFPCAIWFGTVCVSTLANSKYTSINAFGALFKH